MTSSSSIGLPPGAARDLVDLLRELASAGDSTNASIARKAGVSASYVSQILNGRRIPSPDVAARIANAIEGADRHELAVRGLAEKAAEARRYDRAHRAVEAVGRTGADIEATSVAFYAGLPDRMGLAAVGNSRGKLEWALGEVKASAAAHESALSAAREIDNQLEEADAHLGIAQALLAEGAHAEARDAAERARTIYTRIGAAGIDRAEALLARM